MRRFGFGRATKLVAAMALVAGGTAAQVAITSSASAAAPVTTESEFRDAWGNDTTVTLGANIDLTCQDGALLGESQAVRDLPGDGTLDGQGYTITQTCASSRVLQIGGDVGAMRIENVTITGGQAIYEVGLFGGNGGAGIQSTNGELLTVINSNISGNATCEGGGGIEMDDGGELEISGSTFANNFADFGGGVASYYDAITVQNSTFTGNSSWEEAGGIGSDEALTLVYSTVTQNAAGVDIPLNCNQHQSVSDQHVQPKEAGLADNVFAGSDFNVFASIVAQRAGGNDNCYVNSQDSFGYNFSDDDTCGFDQSTDSVSSSNDPTLGDLGDNGGPTPTLLPLAGSPVIDAIPSGNCLDGGEIIQSSLDVDQREFPRPETEGGKCDIGAVEVQNATLDVAKVVAGTNGNAVPSAGYSFSVACSDGTTGTLTVADATIGGTSGALDGIKAYSTCTVREAPVVYTKTNVTGQPTVTYDPGLANTADGFQIGERANTVTVTNDYALVNLLGEVVIQPRFTG